jgi:hypothetical protein
MAEWPGYDDRTGTVFALASGMRWPSNELHVVLTDLVWTGIFITVVFILAG